MKIPSKKEREALQRSLLERGERYELPDQIFENWDELQAAADLVERGYLDGSIMRAQSGHRINVAGPTITPLGIDYLESIRSVTIWTRIRKHPVVAGGVAVVVGIAALVGFLAAFTDNLSKLKANIHELTAPSNEQAIKTR